MNKIYVTWTRIAKEYFLKCIGSGGIRTDTSDGSVFENIASDRSATLATQDITTAARIMLI